jgi:hypothetical protein
MGQKAWPRGTKAGRELIEDSRALWSRVQNFGTVNPDEWQRFFRRISGSVMTVRCGKQDVNLNQDVVML